MTNFNAVLIGGSAGSLEPLRKIVSQLPIDLLASVFIAIHIEPTAERMLVPILKTHSQIYIKYPLDEEFYQPMTVYVAPPGHHMLLTYQKVWIFPANFVYMPKPNIDLMFQSAASEFGDRAIGVILSGYGNDGAIGIKAIKEKGGVTIAQSIETSKVSDMPKAASDSGSVDYVLAPEVIPSMITRLVKGDQTKPVLEME